MLWKWFAQMMCPCYLANTLIALSLSCVRPATPVCSYLTKFCISFSIFNAANRLRLHTNICKYWHTHTNAYIVDQLKQLLSESLFDSFSWWHTVSLCRCNKLSKRIHIHMYLYVCTVAASLFDPLFKSHLWSPNYRLLLFYSSYNKYLRFL